MPKPGKTIETKVEYVTEDGQRLKKTTITTTTVSETPGGGYKTKTSRQIRSESNLGPDEVEKVTTKFEELTAGDVSDEEHDTANAMNLHDTQKFREDCIDAINKYRKKHSADKLKGCSDLTVQAQEHAVKMLAENKLSTIQQGRLGQSLSMKMPRPSGKDVAKHWYEEGDDYNYSKKEFVKGKGNFTQIIWADCKKIGVGVASNKEGATFTIALFDPPGNVQGQYQENVKSK